MAMTRESSFMPTIKCSTCGKEIQISMMGEHVCTGEAAPERREFAPDQTCTRKLTDSPAAMPSAASFFARLMGTTAAAPAPAPTPAPEAITDRAPALADKLGRAPPALDTSAASTLTLNARHAVLLRRFTNRTTDRSYVRQAELTPRSLSSGSRSVSPKTPNGRPGMGRPDDHFAPQIAANSPRERRPGGYGGFGDSDAYESDYKNEYPSPSSPKKAAGGFLQRMNSIAPGPFDSGSKGRNVSQRPGAPEDSTYDTGRPGTSSGNLSSSVGSVRAPRAPRTNGYGGFGPPGRDQERFEPEPFGTGNRAGTFPRQSEGLDAPARTPSAPGPRPDRLRKGSADPGDSYMASERTRRPSRVETSRAPPPRTSLIQPRNGSNAGQEGAPAVPAINLAQEFGVGNPYHSPSESTSSSTSGYSNSVQTQTSQASSRSSPARSASSKQSRRKPSDTSTFDNLMADLQMSMNEAKALPLSPLQPPPKDKTMPMPIPNSPRFRPPPPERGYDPRIDPAVQSGRGRTRSPLASPDTNSPPTFGAQSLDDNVNRGRPDPRKLAPGSAPAPSPRFPPASLPDQRRDFQRNNSRSESRSRPQDPMGPNRNRSMSGGPRENLAPTRTRSQSRPRTAGGPGSQGSRGDCKSCGLAIKGKSISSADGRLTGRYHKACFVCTTCKEPFTSATFYVLDDKPYCERHYHELNGSLCGSCGDGIEGQYLEDEATKKYHVGCFRCGDCGKVLRDGYFEVNGKAFCEKDAWRRVQQPPPSSTFPNSNPRLGPSTLGLPGGPRAGLANGGSRLAPRPRMEKRMTRLGMM